MPKSKRAKVVHLTKVDKKGKAHSLEMFAKVQSHLEKYLYVFVFSVDNMRNTFLKKIRSDFPNSSLIFGKTKVMSRALGHDAASAPLPGTDLLTPYMHGEVGLFFTSDAPSSIITHFSTYTKTDFARAGTPATRSFVIPARVVYSTGGEMEVEDDVALPHGLEPELRRLGMPTRLVTGRVELENEFVVCREGDILDSRQTRLLKLFGVATSEFRVRLVAYWSAATHEITEIPKEDEKGEDENITEEDAMDE